MLSVLSLRIHVTPSARQSPVVRAFGRALACLAGIIALPLAAQVPQTVGYQGRVLVDGKPFSGTGQFKFAIIDDGAANVETATAEATVTTGSVTSIQVLTPGNGYTQPPTVTISGGGGSGAQAVATISAGQVTGITMLQAGFDYLWSPSVTIAPPPPSPNTLWSHDGSSVGGAQPAAAVPVPVAEGVFSVVLGSPAEGMQPVPASVFGESTRFLRIWFSDGSGFALLSPDQPIASVPYALRASLADTVVPGSVGPAQFSSAVGVWNRSGQTISTSQQVGVGAASPNARLQVVGNASFGMAATHAAGLNSFATGGLEASWGANLASGEASFAGGGDGNRSTGGRSFVGGGSNNWAQGLRSFVAGGFGNTVSGANGFAAGDSNVVAGSNGFVAGGLLNQANGSQSFAAGQRAIAQHTGAFVWASNAGDNFSSTAANQFLIFAPGGVGIGTNAPAAPLQVVGRLVAGESRNSAPGLNAFVTGGQWINESINWSNAAGGDYSAAVGGISNTSSNVSSFVGGGQFNQASGSHSFVGGGIGNSATGNAGFVAGGTDNVAAGDRSFAAGRRAHAVHNGAFVWGDHANSATDFASTGENQFLIRATGGVGIGANQPLAQLHVTGSAIVGSASNRASGTFSMAAGGSNNQAIGMHALIAGGENNYNEGSNGFIGGGFSNSVLAVQGAVVGGGGNAVNGLGAVVGGGFQNNANGGSSFIGGGEMNTASGLLSLVAGGLQNVASGSESVALGGASNTASGYRSYALGQRAKALHANSFVWADGVVADFSSTANNQFLIRASGGVGIGTASPIGPFHVRPASGIPAITMQHVSNANGWSLGVTGTNTLSVRYGANVTTQAEVGFFATNGAYTATSDRRLKRDIERLEDGLAAVLALRPSTYRFTAEAEDAPRSIGLIAQEVQPILPELVREGDGYLGISYGEIAVLAIAAIQEQQEIIDGQAAALAARDAELEALRDRQAELEARLASLERLLHN
jgi:hypothetical protein